MASVPGWCRPSPGAGGVDGLDERARAGLRPGAVLS